ncbi:hypothetical protein HK19_12390 [Acetobacter persici]|uniref:Uncharacterized protein n=1 Tax=Acetobacter persici TaxID=1076596 RepID=A0A1U9LFR8_9PROT|nr:hypothetical protein A0U91_10470 [Acetobacter persici]OUI93372.1 hypothetical protein HK19_12390 [Acetobacter persici]
MRGRGLICKTWVILFGSKVFFAFSVAFVMNDVSFRSSGRLSGAFPERDKRRNSIIPFVDLEVFQAGVKVEF